MPHKIKSAIKSYLLKRLHINSQLFGNASSAGPLYYLPIPPGHYYSPIPDINEIKESEERIFTDNIVGASGIDLNLDAQLALLPELSKFVTAASFPQEQTDGFRFFHHNPSINRSDSLTLHAMLCHLRPKHVIEVGSGYSSAMMLDTNEKYLNGETTFTFIEPYPADILYTALEGNNSARLIQKKLQEVPLSEFQFLESGDILYIDSTHVSKIGSDVNYNIFQILPSLKKGVFIHLHDVLWPFEYPRVWIYDTGYHWNEAYLLRAFLQYNTVFKIRFWAPCLQKHYPELMQTYYPLPDVPSSGSIWIEKVQ